MSDDTKISCWAAIIIALVLSVIACCIGLVPQTVYTNTPADEPKIEELISNELKNDGMAYQRGREKVMETFYTKETQDGWGRTSTKIFFLLSALSGSVFLLILFSDFWGKLGIGEYFRVKKEEEAKRTIAYKKTLDDFIRVQGKINKDMGL